MVPIRLRRQAHTEVEVWRIDTDEQRRLNRPQAAKDVAPDACQLWQMGQHFRIAAQREFGHRVPDLAAGAFHERAANAGKARPGDALTHGVDQLRTQRVAGRFPGDDADGDWPCGVIFRHYRPALTE
jgi:hypothetical protein